MTTVLADLVASLVAVDSVNPGLAEDGAGEQRVAVVIASWLERAGLEVTVTEVAPGRPNVVARRRALHGGPRLLLTGHMDTVGLGGMGAPRLDGDRLVGRGAYDMKGGLAAAMVAAMRVDGVVFAAVCDEELASIGTSALDVAADAAIVPEPTEEGVAIAHKGFAGFTITTEGVAAHGSMPHLGEDAILAMAPVLARLQQLDDELQSQPPYPLLGTASLHASLIEGGQEFSTYPARCTLDGEVRTVPGTDVRALLPEATIGVERGPLATPPDSRIAQLLLRHTGTEPIGMPYWTDAALLSEKGIPSVVYGPCGGGAHGDEEWVSLTSVERVAVTLTRVARDFCSAGTPTSPTPPRRRST